MDAAWISAGSMAMLALLDSSSGTDRIKGHADWANSQHPNPPPRFYTAAKDRTKVDVLRPLRVFFRWDSSPPSLCRSK